MANSSSSWLPHNLNISSVVNVTLWDFTRATYRSVSVEVSHDKILIDAERNGQPIKSDREFFHSVAEEIFDLSNNPCREDEWAKYKARSLSTGDMVELIFNDQVYTMLCASNGWKVLEWNHPSRLSVVGALAQCTDFLARTEIVNLVRV